MTYIFILCHSERSEESHRRTDEVYTLLTLVVGYFACAQYDVLFLHVILNEVKNPTEELTGLILFTLVVGYFADAQYDVFFLHVILNAVKNPTEEMTRRILLTLVVGYFAYAQYDVLFFTRHPER